MLLLLSAATPNSTVEIGTPTGNIINADSSVASSGSIDEDEEIHIKVKRKADNVNTSMTQIYVQTNYIFLFVVVHDTEKGFTLTNKINKSNEET